MVGAFIYRLQWNSYNNPLKYLLLSLLGNQNTDNLNNCARDLNPGLGDLKPLYLLITQRLGTHQMFVDRM